jgi:hypothetical protein
VELVEHDSPQDGDRLERHQMSGQKRLVIWFSLVGLYLLRVLVVGGVFVLALIDWDRHLG